MKTLVVGSGGREHCLAWKLSLDPNVEAVYIAPGNGGTETLPKGKNIPIDAGDIAGIIKFVKDNSIDLTVIGPEVPLVAGMADAIRKNGSVVFGPGMKSAQLEGDKAFAKEFMKRHGIPTADFRLFDNFNVAETYLKGIDRPMVLKASGLAAGKGVIVSSNPEDNFTALDLIMRQKAFGEAGDQVVIEEKLNGFEASLMVITDGVNFIRLPYSQDHKRQMDNDQGPNTGGMGVFCPSKRITAEMEKRITDEIFHPSLAGIHEEFADDFRGLLYIGLMITDTGPMALEYNVRFGDPETQAVLPLCNFDFAKTLLDCANGKLVAKKVGEDPGGKCVGVVVAANGYPEKYATGVPCGFLDDLSKKDHLIVFHAGTKRINGNLVSAGGRVAAVCAVAGSFAEARSRIYDGLEKQDTSGFFYRKDIAKGLD